MSDTRKAVIAKAMAVLLPMAATFEGVRQYAYYDPPGILTVCYGSTTNVEKGKKYSMDECKQRLEADMLTAVKVVERCAPGLPVNALVAFSDAVYNIGPVIVCNPKNSTAARLLAAGDWQAACRQLPRWVYATVAGKKVELPGLVKRRHEEMRVCLEGLNHGAAS